MKGLTRNDTKQPGAQLRFRRSRSKPFLGTLPWFVLSEEAHRVALSTVRISVVASLVFAAQGVGDCAPTLAGSESANDELQKVIYQQSSQLEKQRQDLEEQKKQFLEYQQRMERMLAEQQASIRALQSRIDSMQSAKQPPSATATHPEKVVRAANDDANAPVSSGQASASPKAAPAKNRVSADQPQLSGPVGQPPPEAKEKRPPVVADIFDQPGVLTPKGVAVLEPSLQYSHSSNERIALVGYTIIPAITIGLIDVRSISRDTFVASVSGRYGLTNRLELEGKIPYVYRTETASTTPYATQTNISTSSADGYDVGDIELGMRYQLNTPQKGPFYVGSLRVKGVTGTDPFEVEIDPHTNMPTELPTGSGFWGIQPGLSVIFPSDPAVFFGSVNYMWNIKRDVGVVNGSDYGEFDPGDSYGFNLGMGLALNENASYSIGYDHSVISRNKRNGEFLPGEVPIHVGSLMLGYSYRLNKIRTINLAFGFGITADAPDLQLTLKMPFNFF